MDLAEFGCHRVGRTYDAWGTSGAQAMARTPNAAISERARAGAWSWMSAADVIHCARDQGDVAADVVHAGNFEVTSLRRALRGTSPTRETTSSLNFSQ